MTQSSRAQLPFFLEIVELLMTMEGIDIHVTDVDGCSPGHYAAVYGDYEIIEALVDAGVDVNVQDKYNCTMAYEAAIWGYIDTLEVKNIFQIFF